MKCPRCGKKRGMFAKNCTSCGLLFNSSNKTSSMQSLPQVNQPVQNQKESAPKNQQPESFFQRINEKIKEIEEVGTTIEKKAVLETDKKVGTIIGVLFTIVLIVVPVLVAIFFETEENYNFEIDYDLIRSTYHEVLNLATEYKNVWELHYSGEKITMKKLMEMTKLQENALFFDYCIDLEAGIYDQETVMSCFESGNLNRYGEISKRLFEIRLFLEPHSLNAVLYDSEISANRATTAIKLYNAMNELHLLCSYIFSEVNNFSYFSTQFESLTQVMQEQYSIIWPE